MNATFTRHWNHILSIPIAEAQNVSLSLIQEGASKRYKVQSRICYEVYHYSELSATKFIMIVNEEEVEEEHFLI